MSEKKENKFFGLWTVVKDLESATEAAKAASIAAFYMVFSYGIALAVLHFSGSGLYGTEYADEFDLYFAYGTNIFIMLLFLWLGFRIRGGKFGSVPFVAIWLLFEVGAKFFMAPGNGIILSIIFTVIALNALTGWYKRKQYLKEELPI